MGTNFAALLAHTLQGDDTTMIYGYSNVSKIEGCAKLGDDNRWLPTECKMMSARTTRRVCHIVVGLNFGHFVLNAWAIWPHEACGTALRVGWNTNNNTYVSTC